ncbi:hypothetical protein NQ318_017500, partial [Aromia moschata]
QTIIDKNVLVNGLTCFECTLSDGNLCSNSLNTSVAMSDCRKSVFTQGNINNEDFICIAVTQQNSTKSIITRRCGLKSESNICQQLREEDDGYKLNSCHVCQEDFCNSSVMLKK